MSFSFNFQFDGDHGDGSSGSSGSPPEPAGSILSAAAAPPSPPSVVETNPARLLLLDVPGATLDESYASAEVRVAPNATSSRQIEFLVADPDRIRLPSNLAEAINGAKVKKKQLVMTRKNFDSAAYAFSLSVVCVFMWIFHSYMV
jgi:hypothetical protein